MVDKKKEIVIKKYGITKFIMKEGNQFLTADSKIVLLLILRSNIHSTKEILPSSNPVTELEYSLIELLLLKSTRTNVLQGYTFVNIVTVNSEYLTFW